MPTKETGSAQAGLKIVTGKLPDGDKDQIASIAAQTLAPDGPKAIRYDEPAGGKHPAKSVIYSARHELVVEALRQPDRYALHHYDRSIPDTKFFLTSDIEEYQKRRRLIWNAFGEQRHAGKLDDFGVGAHADQVTTMIIEQIRARAVDRMEFDILREFSVLVTYYVSARAFGVYGTRNPSLLIHVFQLLKWLQTRRKLNLTPISQEAHAVMGAAQLMIGHLFANFEQRNGLLKFLGVSAARQLDRHIDRAVRMEADSPSGTIITELLKVKDSPALQDIPPGDIDRNIHGILFEFVGTMVVLVGNGFAQCLHQLKRSGMSFREVGLLMQDQPAATAFINECMRMKSPTGHLKRIASTDVELCGVPVRSGDYLSLMIPEACHDPRAFPKPDVFDPGRDPRLYIHFGPHDGPHGCLGPNWSREVIRQMFVKLGSLDALDFISGDKRGLRKAFDSEDSWPVQFVASPPS
ncbi:cytochrome P450 [Henriciella sp.]|uniref:cytochrome P450 n=1 Tax=Henriciella sp. TaxID=1968823 RepID=UPI0017D870A8|nr:cytochrome P450 [Henriciella sp.]HIG21792.1 cytochrome P450 [Henriciella sp.]